eukprot:gene14869-15006_t
MGTLAPITPRLAKLVASLVSNPSDLIVEIGAGTGRLTRALLAEGVKPKNLALVELDPEFCVFLKETLKDAPECKNSMPHIIEGDATKLPEIIPESFKGKVSTVVSAIPFMYLPTIVREQIVKSSFDVLKPTGSILHVTYNPKSPLAFKKDLKQECSQILFAVMSRQQKTIWLWKLGQGRVDLPKNFPHINVVEGNANQLHTLLPDGWVGKIGTIISGIPMVLSESGSILQFTYGPISPLSSKKLGLAKKRLGHVFMNFPPATVWRYGRMGQLIIEQIKKDDLFILAAATTSANNPLLGTMVADHVFLHPNPEELFTKGQVHKTKFIIGTTGLAAEHKEMLLEASKQIPILYASNTSMGVTLMKVITTQIAKVLGPEFDIEIDEIHHRHKVDAPSGTSLSLGEAAAKGRAVSLRDVACFERGSVVGDHTVSFIGEDESIEITHKGISRSLYAKGAVTAAHWLWAEESSETKRRSFKEVVNFVLDFSKGSRKFDEGALSATDEKPTGYSEYGSKIKRHIGSLRQMNLGEKE